MSKYSPFTMDPLHFVGIGGIGMSGIAEILHNLNYKITGSDVSINANVKRLRELGIPIYEGHDPSHIGNAKFLVVSSAIKTDNPEYKAARKKAIPIVRRSEMLAELMRLKYAIAVAGTHGKTTTTSLISAILDQADFDPTIINGGILNAYKTNARLGTGDWMVVESDESDGSFLKLPATIGVVTNIEAEHMEHYGSFDALKDAFYNFIERLPYYGFAAVCIDDEIVKEVVAKVQDRKLLKYGFDLSADIRIDQFIQNAEGMKFDVHLSRTINQGPLYIPNVRLPMYGRHNALNALAAIAIALELDINTAIILKALQHFKGVKRRFTKMGVVNGITIIDDYGHHPTEIKAVLATAKQIAKGKVIAVIQPHRYSRVKDLFNEFVACCRRADHVLISPIYPAGEPPIEGITHRALIQAIKKTGQENIEELSNPVMLAPMIYERAKSGDMVICLGAASVTEWAHKLPSELKTIYEHEAA